MIGTKRRAALAAALIARNVSERITDAAFGVLYLGVPCLLLLWMRTGGEGRAWTFILLLTVWAADGAAFFAGKLIGGPKLWPRFSPNKTWAGFVGGLVGATLAAVAHVSVIGPEVALATAALIGLSGLAIPAAASRSASVASRATPAQAARLRVSPSRPASPRTCLTVRISAACSGTSGCVTGIAAVDTPVSVGSRVVLIVRSPSRVLRG